MSALAAAPDWLRGVVLPEPERGPRGERVVPYEAVAQAVAMADAAMKAKTRAAQRSALAAASLGFQKGVAASQAAMAQQARARCHALSARGAARAVQSRCKALACAGKSGELRALPAAQQSIARCVAARRRAFGLRTRGAMLWRL